jgi:hypothetical protein
MIFNAQPIRYAPSVETPEPDEAETAEGLMKALRQVSETTLKDGGHALRSVHAKSHGILDGRLHIPQGLPPELAQGLFAQPGDHEVVMRLSTIPGDILDDSVSTPRGLGLKIMGVEGERLEGSEGASTQDFVLVNGPSFAAPNGKVFLANLKLLAATTDKAQGAKKVLSAVNRGLEHVVEAFGGKSPNLITLGGQPETHILGESFYSQVPLRWGDYIAKVAVVPSSQALKALTGEHLKINGVPDALRGSVVDFFAEQGGEWEIQVQLCTDLDEMPVENAHKTWDEDKSPYRTVGRIVVEPQVGWSEARSAMVDDGMAFSPWHGLEAHRPLGQIMRLRKRAYEMSAHFRAENNHHPIAEPRSFAPED